MCHVCGFEAWIFFKNSLLKFILILTQSHYKSTSFFLVKIDKLILKLMSVGEQRTIMAEAVLKKMNKVEGLRLSYNIQV